MSTPKATPIFTIACGAGDLPRLTLAAPDGARAEIYLHGSHVTSWVPRGGPERLFLSRRSQFRTGAPIRGGVPVIVPQFGGLGPLPQHGLLRLMPWELVDARAAGKRASARFRAADTEESRRLWPHGFLAELTVTIGGSRGPAARDELALTLAVTNTGAEPFAFTAALHTYLAVADIAATRVEGLTGLRYRDAAAGGVEVDEAAPRIDFPGEVNRIYFDAPAEARLVEAGRTTVIRKAGFPDAVVWNPAAAKCATMSDQDPIDYRRFVCIEAAAVGAPVRLAPGKRWEGSQTVVA